MSLTKTDLKLDGKFAVTGGSLIGNVVYEAIKCKNYPTLPRKIDIIVNKVTELYKREFDNFMYDNFYIKYFDTSEELHEWIKANIMTIPEIQELNLTQVEYNEGITVDDPNRPKYAFTSSYENTPPENEDFIDLEAYSRNLCHDLIRENIEINYSTI